MSRNPEADGENFLDWAAQWPMLRKVIGEVKTLKKIAANVNVKFLAFFWESKSCEAKTEKIPRKLHLNF